jgi:hypothetical protein
VSEPAAGGLSEGHLLAEHHDSLLARGYVVREFLRPGPLGQIADLCRTVLRQHNLAGDLETYHERVGDQETHLRVAAAATAAVNASGLIECLVRPEQSFLASLLGPDILIQAASHLRVGRPSEARDSIDLHRDTFYGSSVWHLNCWFPVVPLQPGCGLLLAEGTHVVPSRGLRDKAFSDSFRSSVARGSVAHSLGFVYRPRTDDTIEGLGPKQLRLLAPALGSYVLFFGCMVHGGINEGPTTRWSIDTRFSRPGDDSTMRSGYFRDLCRGVISRVAEQFYGSGTGEVTSN